MHYELSRERFLADNSPGGGGLVDATTRADTVRVGLSYYFGR